MFTRIPFDKVNWTTSSFLIGTFLLTLTAVPAYLWFFGLDPFLLAFYFLMVCCTGFSITLGYHRLFSHLTFQAHPIIKFFTLFFGAAAFENSALLWCCEHRLHHKHVDHDEDPYDINKGFFWAHIGWLLFKTQPEPPFDNVTDLKRDKMIAFQHRYIHLIAVLVSFVMPAVVGYLWNGWIGALGGFLIPGVARVVTVQHSTFFINSACHYFGRRPYSTNCSARDSWMMAIFTFGEGYHNYHHEFQHDYRNGVKPWQFDPTKWIIWTLSKLGLASKLRRVSDEKILLAELTEAQRQFEHRLASPHLSDTAKGLVTASYSRVQQTLHTWNERRLAQVEVTRDMIHELQSELRDAWRSLKLVQSAQQLA